MSKAGSGKEESKPQNTSSKAPDDGRRSFLKYTAAGVVGAAAASVVEIPFFNNQIQQNNSTINQLNIQVSQLQNQNDQLNSQVQQDQQQIQGLQSQLTNNEAFLTLGINEQKIVEAMVETIIPSEQDSPGAKEAGVIYFIDRQLATDYGKSANMYMKSPFVAAGQNGPITVDGVMYPQGSPIVPFQGGQKYQYNMPLREFWRYGLEALQSYSIIAHGKKFEELSIDIRANVLTDIYNNKPTSFNEIVPQDFFNELIFMTWSGFLMDPIYGGNRQMVGWSHVGFSGTNMGDFYGGEFTSTDLMVLNRPIRLQPASLGQFQQKFGLRVGG